MKYPAYIYAKALAEAIGDTKGKGDEVVKNFMHLVRRNGDEAHLRKIVEEAARLARRTHGIRKVTMETARPLTSGQRKAMEKFLLPGDVVEEVVDPALIAGVRILVNDEQQFDASLKGKLETMFS